MPKTLPKPLTKALVGAAVCSASLSALATDFSVEVINLTRASYYTPLLVAAHPADANFFTSGTAASTSLENMAETGSTAGLVSDLDAAGIDTYVDNPAGGLLGPGASTTAALNTDATPDNAYLSVVAMILPSNDGFMGLNSIEIPTEPGIYAYNVNAYDSGTEANNEVVGALPPTLDDTGFPAPGPVGEATGTGGTGVTSDAEGFVHIHRGVIGDTDSLGGASDIDATVHRWLNPVARVVITVN